MGIKQNLEQVYARIGAAAQSCGRRPDSVKLVAVSKTVPVEKIREGILAGVVDLGENYVQEAREKIETLADQPLTWHFIGHLQSNKAKYAARMFDLIHSVDSVKLAQALDKEARKNGKLQPVLIQVNIAGEQTKSGVSEAAAVELVKQVSRLENLSVRGLMTMPPYFNAPEKVRPFFRKLRELRDRIAAMNLPGVSMDELSMGMTGDFEAAIDEGATLVRIGTAIFGERR
jgi:pyridoxal phosphate enzyme (YggS family)